MNEADTCRKYVVPLLQAAGWDNAPFSIAEQRIFTNPKGRIRVVGGKIIRGKPKRSDYLLRYRADFPIAVVEAKPDYKTPGAGLSQAKVYAEILDLRFAYSTNGKGIVEFDYTTGIERSIHRFPTPDELWTRLNGSAPLPVFLTKWREHPAPDGRAVPPTIDHLLWSAGTGGRASSRAAAHERVTGEAIC